jgi:hypothetical protein
MNTMMAPSITKLIVSWRFIHHVLFGIIAGEPRSVSALLHTRFATPGSSRREDTTGRRSVNISAARRT